MNTSKLETNTQTIERLTAELDAEKLRTQRAMAACAEMRALLQRYGAMGPTQNEIMHALSSDCGKDYQSNDQIGKRVQAAFPSFTQPSGGDDWIDELLGLLRVAHMQRDRFYKEITRLESLRK